jgi:hypothetical protein
MEDSIYAILDDIDQTARDSNREDRPNIRDEQQLLEYESQYYTSQTPGAHHLSSAATEGGGRNPIDNLEHDVSLPSPGKLLTHKLTSVYIHINKASSGWTSNFMIANLKLQPS